MGETLKIKLDPNAVNVSDVDSPNYISPEVVAASRKGDLASSPNLDALWNHKGFNKLPVKEQRRILSQATDDEGNYVVPGLENYTDMDYQNYRKKLGKPVNPEIELKSPTLLDHAMNFARPLIAGAMAAPTGVAVGAASKSPMAGSGAAAAMYGLVDGSLQHAQSVPPENFTSDILGIPKRSIADYMAGSGEQALMGKMLGKVLDPMMKSGGALFSKGAANLFPQMGDQEAQNAFQQYHPTYSQLYKRVTGSAAPVSKWLEDTFNNAYKANLYQKAQDKGGGELTKLIEDKGGSLSSHILGDDIAGMEAQNLHKSKIFSNVQGNIASQIAKVNLEIEPMDPKMLPKMPALPTKPEIPQPQYSYQEQSYLQGNQNVPRSVMISAETKKNAWEADTRTKQGLWEYAVKAREEEYAHQVQAAQNQHIQLNSVRGPVQFQGTKLAAQNIMEELSKKYPDPQYMLPQDQATYALAKNFVDRSTKMSFQEAWDTSKMLGNMGYAKAPEAGTAETANNVQQAYKRLHGALQQDIGDSIGTWKNDPGGMAKQGWEESRQAVKERHAIFGSDTVDNLLDNTKSRIPTLDRALQSPKYVDSILRGGELELPNGVVHTTDVRNKLGGYALNNIFNDSSQANPQGGSSLNTTTFFNKWNDKNFQQVKDKLFSPPAQKAVDDIIRNVSSIDIPGTSHLEKYLLVHKGGLALSGAAAGGVMSLFTGSSVSSHAIVGGMAAGGVELGGTMMAKLLSNPQAAKVLVAMSAGKIPEGMTRTGMDVILKRAMTGGIIYAIGKNGERRALKVTQDDLIPQ